MKTESFRVSRIALAYLGVAQYVRSFWWVMAGIPLFGLIATILGTGLLRGMGIFALLWPFSLPARAILATGRAGKLLERGAWASVEEGFFYLHGQDGQGFKMSLATVRRVERRMGFLVLVIARGAFLAIPLSVVTEEFMQALETETAYAREMRAATNGDTIRKNHP